MLKFIYQWASPPNAYRLCLRLTPWVSYITVLSLLIGLFSGLILAPPDYQQGDGFRIIYVHVPAALLSLMVYSVMAFAAVVGWVWQIKMADVVIKASIPVGASFTLLALITGSLWGKPMWGTWWIWEARLTSELILLFLYGGLMGLQTAIQDPRLQAKATRILVLIGFVDIPIIHYSVSWWHTLHQGATISRFAKPAIAASMLYPLIIMIVAFIGFYLLMVLRRSAGLLLMQERHTTWVRKMILEEIE